MKLAIERGATSVILHVFIQDSTSTSGAGKTGLAYNTASLTAAKVRGGETLASPTLEDITTLGTYEAPSANTKLRFKEVHATNAPGWYEIHLHNDWLDATNTRRNLVIMLFGATGMAPLNIEIELTGFSLHDVDPDVNLVKWKGTAPADLTSSGYLQAQVMRWLTDDAAGTPSALDTNRVQALVAEYATGKAPLQPTVAGRTLDVAVTGEAGVDLDNVKQATAPTTLTNLTVPVVTTVGSVSGAVGSVAGAVGSVTGAVGSVASYGSLVSDIVTAVWAAGARTLTAISDSAGVTALLGKLAGITVLANWLRAGLRKDAADATALSEINTGGGGYAEGTDSQQGIRDTEPLGTAMRGTDGAYTGTPPTVEAIQTGLATAANQTTILNRMGAWTGTGVNTLLGAFKALLSKVATLPSDIGGTFAPADDSTEAISEAVAATSAPTVGEIDTQLSGTHGSGAWGAATGTGAWVVTCTVTDDAGDPVEGATVRYSRTGESYEARTNASGVATPGSLDAGTWTESIYKAGYSYTPASRAVNGDEAFAATLTTNSAPAPSTPDLCVITGTLLDGNGVAVSGAEVRFTLTETGWAKSSGNVIRRQEPITALTNASGAIKGEDGTSTLELVRTDTLVYEGTAPQWRMRCAQAGIDVTFDLEAASATLNAILAA